MQYCFDAGVQFGAVVICSLLRLYLRGLCVSLLRDVLLSLCCACRARFAFLTPFAGCASEDVSDGVPFGSYMIALDSRMVKLDSRMVALVPVCLLTSLLHSFLSAFFTPAG